MARFLFQVFGVALVLSGFLWALQGFGLVMWPPESFMLGQREWAGYGLVTAAAGILLIWLTRNRAKRD